LVYFVVIWYILWSFGIFSRFGMLHQDKSGIPDFFIRHLCRRPAEPKWFVNQFTK
jgi:hypothetical protein